MLSNTLFRFKPRPEKESTSRLKRRRKGRRSRTRRNSIPAERRTKPQQQVKAGRTETGLQRHRVNQRLSNSKELTTAVKSCALQINYAFGVENK